MPTHYRYLMQPLRAMLAIASFLMAVPAAHATLPIEQWKTSHGVRVYYMHSPAIPMLDLEVRFDAGSWLDPDDKVGVARLTARLLDAGAGEYTEAQLADQFARIGALRSAWASDDSAGVRLRTLSSEPELAKALTLFRTMIARPSFETAAFERERSRNQQAVREADNRASAIAARALYRLSYGNHPYAWRATESSLSAIDVNDIRQFHLRYYVRERAVIAMVGALDRDAAQATAEQIAEALAPSEVPAQDLPQLGTRNPVKHEFVAHPGAQSHIYLGKPLISRGDPDYFALLVANNVLGGASFVSRLYKEIREERGLAYSVSSGFSLARRKGLFTVALQTQRDKTARALEAVREVVRQYVREGPTENELAVSRANLAGGFVFRIDSNRKILGLLSAIGFHQLDLNYLDTWVDRINAVTVEQARAALARHLDPESLITIVVGDVEGLEP